LNTVLIAACKFGLPADSLVCRPLGKGLINKTWRLDADAGSFVIQQMNSAVFPDPAGVIRNSAIAAMRVDDALRSRGDDDPRHRLDFLTATDSGHFWFEDPTGSFWRMARLIPRSRSANAENPGEMQAAARALGQFPGLVAEGNGPRPKEILKEFHDTPSRLDSLKKAGYCDPVNRLKNCRHQYNRLLELAGLAERISPGNQPPRLVHNDAKLDNVLVDEVDGRALCVVDLDTVMPGLAAHDFGDLVRSSVTGRPEDESDPDKIQVRRTVYSTLAVGYLQGAADWIDQSEKVSLADGVLAITYEQAIRFLTDFLEGDRYYQVQDSAHNLRRARAQLQLLEKLLEAEPFLRSCIEGL